MYVSWALLCLAAEAALTAVKLPFRKKKIKNAVRIIISVSELLISIACAVIVMAGPIVFRPVQPFLFALYAVLFADSVVLLSYSVYCVISKTEAKFLPVRVVSAVFALVFIICGTVNMQSVRPDYHTYYSPKISKEHKIVFAADIHAGSAQSSETLKKTVEAMKSEGADCIILGGDIVDDYTTLKQMQDAFALFADSEAPVYYVYGNHDRQRHADYARGRQFTEQELADTLDQCGITALIDEYAEVDSELILLGREDISEGEGRADIASLANPAPHSYLVVADHQPGRADENLETGMDLQLSGHTHAGQLFPLGLFYRIAARVCGEYAVGDAVLYVSPGACGWRVPFRTESHCCYEVISIMPMK